MPISEDALVSCLCLPLPCLAFPFLTLPRLAWSCLPVYLLSCGGFALSLACVIWSLVSSGLWSFSSMLLLGLPLWSSSLCFAWSSGVLSRLLLSVLLFVFVNCLCLGLSFAKDQKPEIKTRQSNSAKALYISFYTHIFLVLALYKLLLNLKIVFSFRVSFAVCHASSVARKRYMDLEIDEVFWSFGLVGMSGHMFVLSWGCHALSRGCLVLSWLVRCCRLLSCVVLCRLALFCVVPCLILSCLVLSCLVLPCIVLSCLVLSCLVVVVWLPCLALSGCLVAVLSCLVVV